MSASSCCVNLCECERFVCVCVCVHGTVICLMCDGGAQ